MALRGRREPPSQSDGLGGPSYRFPQIVTALSIQTYSGVQRREFKLPRIDSFATLQGICGGLNGAGLSGLGGCISREIRAS